MSGADALAAFRALTARWRLSDEQAADLLGVSVASLQGPGEQTLDEDVVARIGHLTAIARALNTLYSRQLADAWMTQPQPGPPFNGGWPLDLLSEGGEPACRQVRELLESRL